MNNSAHARYRKRLTALTDDTLLRAAISDAVERRAWRPGRTWVRTFGRFDPEREPFATLVYEGDERRQEIIHVEVFAMGPIKQKAEDVVTFDDNVGWVRIMRFPSDRLLTTITSVLAQRGSPTVVRYRPERRCTIRFDENGHTRFAKIYPKKFVRYGRGERIHATNVALWHAASRGELAFAVARPERWDAAARTLWQAKIDGAPALPKLFGREGRDVAERMGRAAASLTCSGIKPHRIFDRTAQLAASLRCGEELGRRIPQLAPVVGALLATLEQMQQSVEMRPLRPIHGDMDASQWLDDGSQLGLADFDDFALGDPELDVATFLAELDYEDQLQLPVEQLSEAFCSGYEAVAEPLNQKLLTAYMAHKHLHKALRSARALRSNGDAVAERHLARARRAL